MIRSIGRIFSLFYRYGRKTKRTKVFYGISVFPVLLALLIKVTQFFSVGPSSSGMQIFSNMIMTFYLQFLILILTLFFGTSVCSDEVESKTLTYLSTRPIPKPAVILGKYAAYCVLAVIMTAVGVVLSFVFLNLDKLLDFSLYPVLLKDIGVLTLGIICYMSFFTLIGTFMKRSIIFGLVFSFGWENVIQYFPGSTQKFAIVHYLKSLLPPQFSGKGFAVLLFQLEPTPAGTSVAVLIILTGIFLGLACFVFTQKEYILED
jgi:ABC-type transport system involved in multi-copper enzyme maturation permease subunit